VDYKFLIDTTADKDMDKGFTLSFLFSKQFCVTPFFNALAKMRIPLDNCHLIIFDNTDKKPLGEMLYEIALDLKDRFYSLRFYKSYRQGSQQILVHSKKSNKVSKIPFIMAAYKDIVRMVTTNQFIHIEDDTICPPHTILRLLRDAEVYGSESFISGVEPNRITMPFEKTRLGVHYFHVKKNTLLQRVSLSPKCQGVKKVDAAGHYCFITSKKTFRRGMFKMPVFRNNPFTVTFDGYHTYNLTRNNIPVYADFNIKCFHIHPTPEKTVYTAPDQANSQLDCYIPEYDTWAIGIILNREIKERPIF